MCDKRTPKDVCREATYKDVYTHVFVTSTSIQRLQSCILLIQYSTKEYGFDTLKSPGDEGDSFCFNWVQFLAILVSSEREQVFMFFGLGMFFNIFSF